MKPIQRRRLAVIGFLAFMMVLGACSGPYLRVATAPGGGEEPLGATTVQVVCGVGNEGSLRSLSDDGSVSSVAVVVTNAKGKRVGSGELVKQGASWSGTLTVMGTGRTTFTAHAMSAEGALLYAGELTQTLAGSDTVTLTLNLLQGVQYFGTGAEEGGAPPVPLTPALGEAFTLPDATGSLTKSGYVFMGWNTAPDGSGQSYAVGDTMTYAGPMALHALWLPDTALTVFEGVVVAVSSPYTGGPLLILPPGITSIAEGVNFETPRIERIVLGKDLTNIAGSPFSYCSRLTRIDVSMENSEFASVDGVLYNKSLTTLVRYPAGRVGAFQIPASVQTVSPFAFAWTSSLSAMTIPASVHQIGAYALSGCARLSNLSIPGPLPSVEEGVFYSCSSLTAVSLPASVTSLGSAAFSGCTKLTTLALPASLQTVGSSAFQECYSLTSLTLPSSVSSIGDFAFYWCTQLTQVTMDSPVPPAAGSLLFLNTPTTLRIVVPQGSVAAYQGAPGWSFYSSQIWAP